VGDLPFHIVEEIAEKEGSQSNLIYVILSRAIDFPRVDYRVLDEHPVALVGREMVAHDGLSVRMVALGDRIGRRIVAAGQNPQAAAVRIDDVHLRVGQRLECRVVGQRGPVRQEENLAGQHAGDRGRGGVGVWVGCGVGNWPSSKV